MSYQRDNIKNLADELGIQVVRIYKWRAGDKNDTKVASAVKKQNNQEAEVLIKPLINNYLQSMTLKNSRSCLI
mgnify:CR=1 FL=1